MAQPQPTARPVNERGNDKVLIGFVLAVLTFWLFANTAGTVAPAIMADINANGVNAVNAQSMNLAVSLLALMSGLFTVLMGGIADRVGRIRMTMVGLLCSILGSLLLVLASGAAALPLLLIGRALQGFSGACIMPSTLALVKTYWDGPARQRAVSIWSMGTFGGSGLSALFGGTLVTLMGWRGIFMVSIVVAFIAIALIWGTPDFKVEGAAQKKFDVAGMLVFQVGTLALMVVLLFGAKLGWGSPTAIILIVGCLVAYGAFYAIERRVSHPFIDFDLFSNKAFTGAVVANFFVNGTIGMLIVSQQLIQLAGHKPDGKPYTPMDAGLLTLGYAICVLALMRVGERLLQKVGARKPMIWGALLVAVAAVLLMQTQVMMSTYVVLAIIAYCLFGTGLAFFATPATDAALTNLPAEQAGTGAGIYKMGSSLGSAIGTAISLAVFTGVRGMNGTVIGSVVSMQGRQDNVMIRQAGTIALAVSLVFLLFTIVITLALVPKQGERA